MIPLPRSFKPTHATAGLDGYPAIDVFGNPNGGDEVQARFVGIVRRISGKPPGKGGRPGGPYGFSLYIRSPNGDERYLTHFGTLSVKVGEQVGVGTFLGYVCNSAVSGKPGTSHIHYGLKRAAKPVRPPRVRLLDVVGPKGNNIARRKTPKQIEAALPRWVERFGAVTVRAAR